MRTVIIFGLAALAAAPLAAIQGTLHTETGDLTGDIKWQPRSKSYLIISKKKGTEVSSERAYADITGMDIPPPPGFAKAAEQVEKGQGANAVAALSKIVTDYRMLHWDKVAGRYLAFAYLDAGQPQKAYEACNSIISEDRTAAYRGDLAAAYWQALLKLGKNDQLENALKKAVSSGDRAASAAALVMRGDIIRTQGKNSPDSLKSALADAYLRVALMYNQQSCARECTEAMTKAAECFDKLGQASRAEKLRAQAKAIQ